MLYEVNGSVLDDREYKIILYGAAETGISKRVDFLYPNVEHRRLEFQKKHKTGFLPVWTGDRICVPFLITTGNQFDYENYEVFDRLISEFAERLNSSKIPKDWKIGIPFRFGFGHGFCSNTRLLSSFERLARAVPNDVYIVKRERFYTNAN